MSFEWKSHRARLLVALVVPVLGAAMAAQQVVYEYGDVSDIKVSRTTGGFTGNLTANDRFGRGIACLGDLDGDGVQDFAVGPHQDNEGGIQTGSVWILLRNEDGTIKAQQRISLLEGNFGGQLDDYDDFGFAVAGLGDLDGDGVPDMAASARGDDDGAQDAGAVWILFLMPDGTVKTQQKISLTQGGFTGTIDAGDKFGQSLGNLGDLDGDGIPELAVGADLTDGGGVDRGAVHILYLNADGTVKTQTKIGDGLGGFTLTLRDQDQFGFSVAGLGDLDGDGVRDLLVGANRDQDSGVDHGAVYVLLLNQDGTVHGEQKITDGEGGFTGHIDDGDRFGSAVSLIGDLDGDGFAGEIAVGVPLDDDGGSNLCTDTGAVWILFLDTTGNVVSCSKISDIAGNFGANLDIDDRFGVSLANVGDLNGDGTPDLVSGASRDDDGGLNFGSYYEMHLGLTPVQVLPYGCGLNTDGTLYVATGQPDVGRLVRWALDNPYGTQLPGSSTILFFSFAPDPNYPCGTIFPTFGMSAPNTPAELLVNLTSPDPVATLMGTNYNGPGMPGFVTMTFPSDATLIGMNVFIQGYILDKTQANGTGVRIGLTNALQLTVGQ